MKMYYLSPTDSPARFIGEGTDNGLVRRCEWTGDGDDLKVQQRIDFFQQAGMQTMALDVGALINVSLDGPLPPGFTSSQFANTAEIDARASATVDQVARDAAFHANEGVDNIDRRLAAASEALVT